jgi:DNA-binding CsgD family transcriptional regulator/tetratricopeptide (TPR) repeat protein
MLDESGARIILLVAPAGYGKTTLAREWFEDSPRRSAWYRGGPASSDVAALSVGLARTVVEIAPEAGERMQKRLKATDRPDQDTGLLAEMLAEDVADWPDDAWLVIDDYQFVAQSASSEEFVGTLTDSSPLKVLVTSRRRPSWASARKRIYGEVFELSRDALAMNEAEGLEALGQSLDAPARTFLAEAGGWPAIIGLAAAATNLGQPRDGIPPALYDYFAEEIFSALGALQKPLCVLALSPVVSTALAETLLGPNLAPSALSRASAIGLLEQSTSETYQFHPLFRRFLKGRFDELWSTERSDLVERITDALLADGLWDDAFTLIQEEEAPRLTGRLVEAAYRSMLGHGRISTVEAWLAYAHEQSVTTPALQVAEAEMAFRSGAYERAEVLGLHAAGRLGPNHYLASLAYTRAGQSAHLDGRVDDAQRHFGSAVEAAKGANDRRHALWGQFICSLEKEGAEPLGVFNRFASLAEGEKDEELRIINGRIFLALRDYLPVTDDLLSSIHLLDDSQDALIRSSFLNIWCALANYLGHYEEAHAACVRQLSDLERYRLYFAIPHTHLRMAGALRGLREFPAAVDLTERIERAGEKLSDPFLVLGARITNALTELGRGRIAKALETVSEVPRSRMSPGWTAEALACRGLVHAVGGEHTEAAACVDEAESLTRSWETRGLASYARAISALRRGSGDASGLITEAYDQTRTSRNMDAMVTAYRSYPPLLVALWRIGEPDVLEAAVHRARDVSLARAAGLPVPRRIHSMGQLSPREQEVHALLAQGLTNAEIAQSLFISVSTVKVHVRHILEKLGARTRTEAASIRSES